MRIEAGMFFAIGIIRDANPLEIVRHPWFVSAFLAGGGAQLLKFLINWWRTRNVELRCLRTAGEMPSSHSALVSALSTAVGLTDGFDSAYAMIAVGFGLLVLCDAATLRREAGEHARLLNKIVEKMKESEDLKIESHRLEEKLGHRRREVIAGVLFGIVTAFAVCSLWDFWK